MLEKYLRECLQKINLLIKKHFKKEIYMCVVNEQDSQFPGSHWVILYHDKQNTYFTDSLGRDCPLWLRVQETRLQSIWNINMFRTEIM